MSGQMGGCKPASMPVSSETGRSSLEGRCGKMEGGSQRRMKDQLNG
jgi:hypothetical protein